MKLTDQTPSDNENSKYIKFDNIGEFVTGLYLKSETVAGKFGPRLEMTLRTKEGEKVVTCTKMLERIITSNLDSIRGKVLTITYVASKDIGKGNPMKVFDVDVRDPKPGTKAAAPEPETDDDSIPF